MLITYPTEDNKDCYAFNKNELTEMIREENIQGFLMNSIQNNLKFKHGHYVCPEFDEEDIFWSIKSIQLGVILIECWVSDVWNMDY